MEQCSVCGQTYGLTHSCPGAHPAAGAGAIERRAPTGFAPGYYFLQALGVVRFDDAAIAAASRDKNALLYGTIIWLIGQLLIVAGQIATTAARGVEIRWLLVIIGTLILIFLGAALTLLQYGICHLLARWWFGARGTYLCVLRAMLLGSVVTWLIVIPYIGFPVAALWGTAVLMRVFEEVDGVERMKAYGLAAVVGFSFWILTFMLFMPKR